MSDHRLLDLLRQTRRPYPRTVAPPRMPLHPQPRQCSARTSCENRKHRPSAPRTTKRAVYRQPRTLRRAGRCGGNRLLRPSKGSAPSDSPCSRCAGSRCRRCKRRTAPKTGSPTTTLTYVHWSLCPQPPGLALDSPAHIVPQPKNPYELGTEYYLRRQSHLPVKDQLRLFRARLALVESLRQPWSRLGKQERQFEVTEYEKVVRAREKRREGAQVAGAAEAEIGTEAAEEGAAPASDTGGSSSEVSRYFDLWRLICDSLQLCSFAAATSRF